ncbi:MAG: hypothetical protein AAGF81_14035, partial [Pseudomonadota bacterium]
MNALFLVPTNLNVHASSNTPGFSNVEAVVLSVTIDTASARELGLDDAINLSQLAALHVRSQLGDALAGRKVIPELGLPLPEG